MKLYRIEFDGESYWVEAECFAYAIDKWKIHVKILWGDDYDGTEEPESCTLIHNDPVIR